MLADENDLTRHALELARSKWGGEVSDGRLMPLADALSDLIDGGPRCSVAGNWFVVQADARQERLATESIAKAGFAAYRPIVTADIVSRGRKRSIEKSMFGMYLFVKCEPTEANWHKVRLARGVRRLVLSAGGGWICVPDQAMQVVRAVEAKHATASEVRSRFIYHLAAGDMVRIKEGAFAHFFAQLESAVDESGRIAALVEIFGRKSRLQLEAHQVERC
jgi:transcription antitermination factor NusG